ncbi:MAG: leucyl/phenylalanyl-tRNA--protein transferase [Candidatus Thermofonsia bacterium]|nr:MAG: leucyl/phenylalanyl-tRNA--protein transferase [Candidatus Thermofonsia bacterium]
MNHLTPELLISAYCQGIFPMAHDDGNIYWYDPDPRAIIPLENFHIPRSLHRTLKKKLFTVTRDQAFSQVIRGCAAPAPDREHTWISDEIIEAYERLYGLGWAHSVEVWRNGRLAGGLYGVAVGGLFAGESMFSRETDASKVALVHLVHHLKQQGFTLLDTQFLTPHLQRFGAVEIPASRYKALLRHALTVNARF